MERLTIPDEKIEGGVRRTVIDAREVKKNAMTIYWALKKYEDTGLTPLEIMKLVERNTAKAARPISDRSLYGICLNCGQTIFGDHRFCPDCGQRLKWEDRT